MIIIRDQEGQDLLFDDWMIIIRDQEGQDVLLFIDNIFRFTQVHFRFSNSIFNIVWIFLDPMSVMKNAIGISLKACAEQTCTCTV